LPTLPHLKSYQYGGFGLDESSPLGVGAYGSVFKAQLRAKDGYEMTVAVKTIDSQNTDVTYFKALLLELKVMSRLGKHDHVVEFLGASTSEIRESANELTK